MILYWTFRSKNFHYIEDNREVCEREIYIETKDYENLLTRYTIVAVEIDNTKVISMYKDIPSGLYRLVEYKLEDNDHNGKKNNTINNYYFKNVNEAIKFINESLKREESKKLNSNRIKK